MRGKVCRSIPKRIKEWDHPRICGEKESKLQEIEDISGSPPHMRGKVATGRQTVCRCGITPAYAGKRGLRKRGSRNPADHPRICGEKAEMGGFIPRFSGSPPRMRGKVLPDRGRVLGVGITPAYAGKSLRGFAKVMALSDHPRICGEKKGKMEEKMKYTGSPPHMRGKGHEKEIRIHVTGITPAYAGKSSLCC